MLEFFEKKVDDLYNILLQPLHSMYKQTAIYNYKKEIDRRFNGTFSEFYYSILNNSKERGIVYTPEQISTYMTQNTINVEDIVNNPYLKILDPACGCGNILIPIFVQLKKIYSEGLDEINAKNGMRLKKEEISEHIIRNNLFGFDIDPIAIKILKIDLFTQSHCIKDENFSTKDFLLEESEEKFDIIIGNPPYIGQKAIDKEYSNRMKTLYKEIYKDKGDLSYCFFQKSLNKLQKSGKLTFITSRYFLESPSGEELRKILKEICSIYKIVDFYGIRPFKNTGIDPVIIFLTNELTLEGNIEIIKPVLHNGKNDKGFCMALFSEDRNNLNNFIMNKNLLNSKGWILRDEKERNIINKIEKKCFTHLSNICESYQGIITGCDRAFIFEKGNSIEKEIEPELIKPWIKSSYINKNWVQGQDQFIIYSDLIQKEEEYPKAINHIIKNKEQLSKRRECARGIRPWYKLQWGRVQGIFEGEKIIFPFKSSSNRFTLDKGSYFSADVYALLLKENVPFTYKYLLFLLNSSLYEYYFKTFAKKLGEDQYEYYPNNLMKLCIPTMFEEEYFNEHYLYNYFELTPEEIAIIENYI